MRVYILEIIFWQSLFIVPIHPATIHIFMQRFHHYAITIHVEIPSKKSGIITDSYCAALFNIVQNCVLSLFIVLLWMYYSSFGFFTFICLYIYKYDICMSRKRQALGEARARPQAPHNQLNISLLSSLSPLLVPKNPFFV